MKRKTDWKRSDGKLILGVLLLASLSFFAVLLFSRAGAEAVVTVNGAETARYPLNADGVYALRTAEGSNTLEIKDGKARLLEADCPDLLCVKQGSIFRTGQSIICLPHKLAVSIEGRGAPEAEVDAMAN